VSCLEGGKGLFESKKVTIVLCFFKYRLFSKIGKRGRTGITKLFQHKGILFYMDWSIVVYILYFIVVRVIM